MRQAALAALPLAMSTAAPADTVYEFDARCRESRLGVCFNMIEDRLDRLKRTGQGRSFCLPRAWGSVQFESVSYPVSLLEHVRLALSAARFGAAGRPVDEKITSIVAEIYPCK